MGLEVKFAQILDLFAIAVEICPFFPGKHMTAQITFKHRNENRE